MNGNGIVKVWYAYAQRENCIRGGESLFITSDHREALRQLAVRKIVDQARGLSRQYITESFAAPEEVVARFNAGAIDMYDVLRHRMPREIQ